MRIFATMKSSLKLLNRDKKNSITSKVLPLHWRIITNWLITWQDCEQSTQNFKQNTVISLLQKKTKSTMHTNLFHKRDAASKCPIKIEVYHLLSRPHLYAKQSLLIAWPGQNISMTNWPKFEWSKTSSSMNDCLVPIFLFFVHNFETESFESSLLTSLPVPAFICCISCDLLAATLRIILWTSSKCGVVTFFTESIHAATRSLELKSVATSSSPRTCISQESYHHTKHCSNVSPRFQMISGWVEPSNFRKNYAHLLGAAIMWGQKKVTDQRSEFYRKKITHE